MTDLTENPQFDPVPLLEDLDDVEGGNTGPSNAPAQALANRTSYLKAQLDAYPDANALMLQAISEHEADPDAHPGYVTEGEADGLLSRATEVGTPGGPVPLGPDGLVAPQYLGERADVRVVEVADETARLALPVWNNATIAHQLDTDNSWTLAATADPSVPGNWDPLDQTTRYNLLSFNGRQGAVVSVAGDYDADQIAETATRTFASPEEKQNWDDKQDTLVSGVNIKTINNQSLLGAGNIQAGFPLILPPIPLYVKDGSTNVAIQSFIGAEPYHSLYSIPRAQREFQVDIPSGDFSAPIASGSVTDDIWQISIILTSNTTYKWRCRDVDVEGTASEWCAPQTFTVETIWINTPAVNSPASGARVPVTTATLKGSGFSGGYPNETHAASYWEVKDTSTDTVIWSSGRTTTDLVQVTLPAGILVANGAYSASVKYEGSSGLQSEWSTPTPFVGPYSIFDSVMAVAQTNSNGTYPYATVFGQDIDTLTWLPNPLPLSGTPALARAISLTQDSQYLAIGSTLTPGLRVFKRYENTYNELAFAAELPNSPMCLRFSPDGTHLAVGGPTSPYLSLYKREGDVFTKLADPDVALTGEVRHLAYSPDGNYLAISHYNAPRLTIYKRNGDTYTKLADPATLPTTGSEGLAFSPDSTYLAVSQSSSPYVLIYKRAGDVFTKLANPASLPTSTAWHLDFSPDGLYLAFYASTMTIYKRTDDVFTKLATPSYAPPGGALSLKFSPDGEHLAVGCVNSPYLVNYKRSGDTFTKLADPAPLPAPKIEDISWENIS